MFVHILHSIIINPLDPLRAAKYSHASFLAAIWNDCVENHQQESVSPLRKYF